MSKPKCIDLTGDEARLRQIAMNHATDVVHGGPDGAHVASEVIRCAAEILLWLTQDRAAASQEGEGARYGIAPKSELHNVGGCLAWFTSLSLARAYVNSASYDYEIWDLVEGQRVA